LEREEKKSQNPHPENRRVRHPKSCKRFEGPPSAWLKPGFKVMNSILGSLPDVLPGKEIVKELKEHVEAGYEVAEHLGEQEEG
jgi:hypothetical protein